MNTEDLDDPAGESTGTLEAAASAFEAILAGEQPGTKKAKKEDEADTSDAEEADDDADPDAETASDEDDAEGEADDEQEKKEASSDDDKPVVTIELDGKATELTKKEIEASYLRQADYTRKTQEAAEQAVRAQRDGAAAARRGANDRRLEAERLKAEYGRQCQAHGRLAAEVEAHVWPMIAGGKFRPVMDSEFALEDASLAHARMESSGHVGKIVLTWGQA